MSKIYEALQRAEEERLARAAATPAAVPEAKPAERYRASEPAPLAAAAAFVGIADPRPDPAPGDFPEAAQAATARHPHGSGLSDPLFDSVVPTPWKPQLDKLPALEERGSAVEQFRSLRTRMFAFRDLNKLKTIMVGSGLPREGKSFIAANLAVSFARHKSTRVLLIDGDMRRSSLHDLFGCKRSPGLSTYLAGRVELREILQRMQVPARSPKSSERPGPAAGLVAGLGSLTFIGGGDEGDKAADLSGSKRFQELIDRASEYFDWIIVDSSPVNLVTDGINLAHACDAVLLVARGGVTRFEAAQRAIGELKNSTILGVVLNASEKKAKDAGYYGYDGYDGDEDSASPAAEEGIAAQIGAAAEKQETGQVAQ